MLLLLVVVGVPRGRSRLGKEVFARCHETVQTNVVVDAAERPEKVHRHDLDLDQAAHASRAVPVAESIATNAASAAQQNAAQRTWQRRTQHATAHSKVTARQYGDGDVRETHTRVRVRTHPHTRTLTRTKHTMHTKHTRRRETRKPRSRTAGSRMAWLVQKTSPNATCWRVPPPARHGPAAAAVQCATAASAAILVTTQSGSTRHRALPVCGARTHARTHAR